jgi:hypothetical protein
MKSAIRYIEHALPRVQFLRNQACLSVERGLFLKCSYVMSHICVCVCVCVYTYVNVCVYVYIYHMRLYKAFTLSVHLVFVFNCAPSRNDLFFFPVPHPWENLQNN